MNGWTTFRATAALLLLNAALSFENWWPTPGIKPDHRLAPELVALWVMLLVAVRVAGALPRRLLTGLAFAYTLLVIGRYVDVTAPALLGRPVNLYWDVPQVPRFLAVIGQQLAPWQMLLLGLGVLLALWGLYRALRGLIAVVARDAVPYALRSRAAQAATVVAVALVAANAAGVQATWPVVSKPVTPTYATQARILLTAWSPGRLERVLPPSPAFDSDLSVLDGLDVKLVFLESYGATVFDDTETRRSLQGSRDDLAAAIAATGRHVVSAFVRSPTYGGGSDMAHLGLLAGIDLSDPTRHDLLLTSDRPTLLRLFRAHGYETFGFYPALSWEWPEGAFYGYEHLVDGPALDYQGPPFGYWHIPDQYAIARFDQLNPIGPATRPRFLFFATINTHIPFRPVPPYQPDWSRVLSDTPYDDDAVARTLAEAVDWTDLIPAYRESIAYTYTWLAGYLRQPAPRDCLLILIGDHQPVGSVTGPNASWDVPVHVITSRPGLLERFEAVGFRPGLEPERPILGGMHVLTRLLLDVLDGRRSLESLGMGATDAAPSP